MGNEEWPMRAIDNQPLTILGVAHFWDDSSQLLTFALWLIAN